jgi:hypothetical protein
MRMTKFSQVFCDICYKKISKNNLAHHLQSEEHKFKASVTEEERQILNKEVVNDPSLIRAEEVEFIKSYPNIILEKPEYVSKLCGVLLIQVEIVLHEQR